MLLRWKGPDEVIGPRSSPLSPRFGTRPDWKLWIKHTFWGSLVKHHAPRIKKSLPTILSLSPSLEEILKG